MNLDSIKNVLEMLDINFAKFLMNMQTFWSDQRNMFNFTLQKIQQDNSKFQNYLSHVHDVWDEPILHNFQYKGQPKQFDIEDLESFKDRFFQQRKLERKSESLGDDLDFENVRVFNQPKELKMVRFKNSFEYVKRCFLLNSCPHTLLLEHVLKIPLVTTKISLKKLNSKSESNENEHPVVMNFPGRLINLIVSPSDRFIGVKLEKQSKLQIEFYDLENPQGQFQPNFASEINKLKVTSFVFLDPPKVEQLVVVCNKGNLHLYNLTENTWEKDLIKQIHLFSIFYLDSKRLLIHTNQNEIGVFSFETRSIGNLIKLNDSLFPNPENFVQSNKSSFIFTPLFSCKFRLIKASLFFNHLKKNHSRCHIQTTYDSNSQALMLNASFIDTDVKSQEKFIYVLDCREEVTKDGVNWNLSVIPNQKATVEFQFKNIVSFRGQDHLLQERNKFQMRSFQEFDSDDSSDISVSKNLMILKWPYTYLNKHEFELVLYRMSLQRSEDETVRIVLIPIKKVGFYIEPFPENQGLFPEDQLQLGETQVTYNLFGFSRGLVVIESQLR
jgi:hypothetical protein